MKKKSVTLSLKSVRNSKTLKFHSPALRHKLFLLFIISVVVRTMKHKNK